MDVRVALENTAGGRPRPRLAGGGAGGDVRPGPPPERLALCLDTCHLFAAGYDIRTPPGLAAVLDRVRSPVGLGQLAAFHLNDSKAGLGSKLDRHENIGAGRIGLAAFRFLLDPPAWARFP